MVAIFETVPGTINLVRVVQEGLVVKQDKQDPNIPPYADISLMGVGAEFSPDCWSFTTVNTIEEGLAIYPQAINVDADPV